MLGAIYFRAAPNEAPALARLSWAAPSLAKPSSTWLVVLSSLLIQGWSVALAARKLDMSFARSDPLPRRVELDLPGQLTREIVGYPVPANSPFLRRGLIPNWARPTLVVRNEEILTPAEAHPVREGDYVYLLAPPEKAQALDRFFVRMPPPASPDPRLLGDFFVQGLHLGPMQARAVVVLGVVAVVQEHQVVDRLIGRDAGGDRPR